MGHPLDGALLKIERAKEHVLDLESRIQTFHQRDPYEIRRYDDPQTGDAVYVVHLRESPPLEWSLIVGEILYDLRSALDHLAWQLVVAGEGSPGSDTGFPIAAGAKEFESMLPGKVQGASPAAVRLIAELKPYRGGNDALWRLHRLAIVDKHRLLITVGSAYKHLTVQVGASIPRWGIRPIPMVVTPANRVFPLEDGTELHRVVADAKAYVHPQFTFEIAFGEGEIVQGEPLIPTLHQLAGTTQQTVELFGSLF